MAWVFVIVGSFLMGAFFYVAWLYGLKAFYVKMFKTKQIVSCKNQLRVLNLSTIPPKEKVNIYIADSKIQSFEPEIITEAEKLYFKQKPFDDLVEYLQQREFYFDDILHTKFKFFRVLNKEHEIVKTLLEYKWNPKTIKSALKSIERGLKTNGRTKTKPSVPRLKEQIEQDIEESPSSESPGTRATARGDSGNRDSRASSNESGTSADVQGITPRQRKLSVGEVVAKRESAQRDQANSYWNRFGA